MNSKKYGITFITLFILGICFCLVFNALIDPFFHYHKPLKRLNYELDIHDQRYINDGIVKNFTYNAIITGSSVTDNFKTSEFNKLFNVNSIKVPLSGSYFKEVNDLLTNAFKYNKNIKYVLRSVEYSNFYRDKDAIRYEINTYPTYLYNDTVFDDAKYLLNKNIIYKSFHTLKSSKSTSFDEYSYWSDDYQYGKEIILASYDRPKKHNAYKLTNKQIMKLKDSINQNFLKLIKENPNTEFYLFYPPYSIYAWDYRNQKGILYKELYGEKIITEMFLNYDNIHIFSFLDLFDIITNPSYYKDYLHYNDDINSLILKAMKNNEHELTKDNYENYYNKIIDFYINYDYNKLFS